MNGPDDVEFLIFFLISWTTGSFFKIFHQIPRPISAWIERCTYTHTYGEFLCCYCIPIYSFRERLHFCRKLWKIIKLKHFFKQWNNDKQYFYKLDRFIHAYAMVRTFTSLNSLGAALPSIETLRTLASLLAAKEISCIRRINAYYFALIERIFVCWKLECHCPY